MVPIFALLVLATVIEISVLIAIGQVIGAGPTILLLLLSSAAGILLLRREGMRTMNALTAALRSRRPPEQEITDGMLLAAAGAMVLLPGFISDVLALALLLPPSRKVLRNRVIARARRRSPAGPSASGFGRGPFGYSGPDGRLGTPPGTPPRPGTAADRGPIVVDSEIVREDDSQDRRG